MNGTSGKLPDFPLSPPRNIKFAFCQTSFLDECNTHPDQPHAVAQTFALFVAVMRFDLIDVHDPRASQTPGLGRTVACTGGARRGSYLIPPSQSPSSTLSFALTTPTSDSMTPCFCLPQFDVVWKEYQIRHTIQSFAVSIKGPLKYFFT